MSLHDSTSNVADPKASYNTAAADYSSRDYWDQRFRSEKSFEWLQPLSTILPFIQAEFEERRSKTSTDHDKVSVLHIGCGSSLLSNELRRLSIKLDMVTETRILNVDFSPGAIDRGRQHEILEFGDVKMEWGVLDLLDWNRIRDICFDGSGSNGSCRDETAKHFDFVVEKSCSDAIACGEDVEIVADSEARSCTGTSKINTNLDVVKNMESPLITNTTAVPPEIALAVYLGRLTRPGAIWIALSYSSSRFDYLKSSFRTDFIRGTSDCHYADIIQSLPWIIERVHTLSVIVDEDDIDVNGIQGNGTTPNKLPNLNMVHRPEIFHYVYVLRRRDF